MLAIICLLVDDLSYLPFSIIFVASLPPNWLELAPPVILAARVVAVAEPLVDLVTVLDSVLAVDPLFDFLAMEAQDEDTVGLDAVLGAAQLLSDELAPGEDSDTPVDVINELVVVAFAFPNFCISS